MSPDAESMRAVEHRPAPRALRRTSRTRWPLSRVLLYVAVELGAVSLLALGLLWLLANS
ncbi:MAG: hypothetical protein ACYS15_12245 [Planctomycetota bacterium]